MPARGDEPAMTVDANNQTDPQPPVALIEALQALRRPLIISHVVPDADALGSMFALACACAGTGSTARVALPEGSLSKRLAFLFEWAEVTKASDEDFAAADGFVTADTAKISRCNIGRERKETDWIAGRPVLNIDHHATNENFGTINWIVPEASSTCEMIYYLLRRMGVSISSTIASLLYAGIQTDTLGFSLPTTNAACLRASADLIAAGADIGELGERLCRSQSPAEFNLLRVIYANTKTLADGDLAYSYADYDEIVGAGCTAADIDDQISVPRSLNGVRLAMLFTEGRQGKTRINFRGSGTVTVVELAQTFGGGGHPQAAGAILNSPIPEAIERVVPRAVEHLNNFPLP